MVLSSDFVFQHDNDPKHTSKVVQNYLSRKRIPVLPWPAQSPDMNPIENLRQYLDNHIPKSDRKNVGSLKNP